MELFNSALSGLFVVLAILVAASVLLYLLGGILEGMTLAIAGIAWLLALPVRLARAVGRFFLHVRCRKWQPGWKAEERRLREEALNARVRQRRLERQARERRNLPSEG